MRDYLLTINISPGQELKKEGRKEVIKMEFELIEETLKVPNSINDELKLPREN